MATTEAVLRGAAADADTDGEDIDAFLPGRRTVTFDRSPKRQRVEAAPPATPPHVPRAPPVTQSPPGPPTAGGSSSDDESVPAPRRKWAPPTAGFSSSDDEDEAPARPADDDTDDGDDAAAAVTPAQPPPPPQPPAQTPAQRALVCLESDAEAMGTTPHGFRRMPTLLLAAYRGDTAAVAALPLLFQRREIVIGLGIREHRDARGKVTSRTRLGSRVVRAPVSDFATQTTPIDNQNALHLAAGPGEERLAFVVAFLDLVGFETGMHLAMERQRDGVSPAWRARQNKHRHVVELYEPLQRGDRMSFMAQLDAARRLVPFEPPRSPQPRPRAPVVARWVQETRRPPPQRRRRAPSPDSSDDDGDSSIEWGPVIPAPARRAPPRPIPEGKEIIEIE